MARQGPGKGQQPEGVVPTKFAETTPQSGGGDMTQWLLNAVTKNTEAIGKLDGTLTAFQAQLTRIETKLASVESEVSGHGKWMHTLKAFAVVVLFVMGWLFVNAVWPWLKPKIGLPP